MKDLTKMSIQNSVTENFKLYEQDYPLKNGAPTEEAINQLINWVRGEYEATESEDKGTISEWFEAAQEAFVNYFGWDNPYIYDKEEREEIWAYIEDMIQHIQVENATLEAATAAARDLGLEEFQIKNNSVLDQTGREVYQIQPEDIAREVLEDFRNFDGFPATYFNFEGVTYYFVKQ